MSETPRKIDSPEAYMQMASERPIAAAGMSIVRIFNIPALVMVHDEGGGNLECAMLVKQDYPHALELASALESAAMELRNRVAGLLKESQEAKAAKAH